MSESEQPEEENNLLSNNKPKNYNLKSITLHWASAVVVIGLFALGWWMVELDYYSKWYQVAPDLHKSIGLTLAAVTLVRISLKLLYKAPAIDGKRIEIVAAKIAHLCIYLLLFTLFISGYLISTPNGRGIEVFNFITVPSLGELFPNQATLAGRVHYYVAITLMVLAAVHALAALKHHFINKDNTLKKMMGTSK